MNQQALQSWWRGVEHLQFLARDSTSSRQYWQEAARRQHGRDLNDAAFAELQRHRERWIEPLVKALPWEQDEEPSARQAVQTAWALERLSQTWRQGDAASRPQLIEEFEELWEAASRLPLPELNWLLRQHVDRRIRQDPVVELSIAFGTQWNRASVALSDQVDFSKSVTAVLRCLLTALGVSEDCGKPLEWRGERLLVARHDLSVILEGETTVPLIFLRAESLKEDDLANLRSILMHEAGRFALLFLFAVGEAFDEARKRLCSYREEQGWPISVFDRPRCVTLISHPDPKSVLREELSAELDLGHGLPFRTRFWVDLFRGARFAVEQLGEDRFPFSPDGPSHRLAQHGPLYARLIHDRQPTGEDFKEVQEEAGRYYQSDLEHHAALVVSDREPEPGAKYCLFEIRGATGLAIILMGSSLLSSVVQEQPLADLLADEISQATIVGNPYLRSMPVTSDMEFFGRELVLQEIVDYLDVGQPVGLFGLRKVGKTSVLKRLIGRLAQRRRIADIDLQAESRANGAWGLYPRIIEKFVMRLGQFRKDIALPKLRLYPGSTAHLETVQHIAKHLGHLTQTDREKVLDGLKQDVVHVAADFMADLHTLHEAVGRPEPPGRMLLIIDEVERLLPGGGGLGFEGFGDFLGVLKAANQEKVLDVLVAGVDPLVNRRERWPRSHGDNALYNALREIWMPPMSEEAVEEMVKTIGLQMQISYSEDALDLIVQKGGGHPFLIRGLCGRAVGKLRGPIQISADKVRSAIGDLIETDDEYTIYLSELWQERIGSKLQRSVLKMLAGMGDGLAIPEERFAHGKSRREFTTALATLERYRLVKRENGLCSMALGLLSDWIKSSNPEE